MSVSGKLLGFFLHRINKTNKEGYSLKDSFFLTRQILAYRLSSLKEEREEAALVQQFLSVGTIYVVADANTTTKDWEAREFGICTQNKTIRLFLCEEDAVNYAFKVGAVLQKKTPMTMKVTSTMIQSVIGDYAQKQFIDRVSICGHSPIRVEVSLSPFVKDYKKESSSTIMSEPVSTPVMQPASVETQNDLQLVDIVRQTLSAPTAAERRKLDQGQQFENFHTLLAKLIQVNGLDMSALDATMGVPAGYTKQLCSDLVSDAIPKAILMNYLKYFGLSEYLNLFTKQCSELTAELKANPKVDVYNIKSANIHTKERFKLLSIRRGKDANHAYVYQLILESKSRKITTIVSTCFNFVQGKDYEIGGLMPLDDSSTVSTRNAAEAGPSPLPSEDEEAAILGKLEQETKERRFKTPTQKSSEPEKKKDARNTGYNRYIDETAEEKTGRELNEILGYIIKTQGCNSQEGKRKLKPLEGHEQTIAAFATYLKDGKAGSYAVRGYTPKKLMHELHYSPYEAFCLLTELEDNPKDTLQRLKYRETDPQYQRIEK